jgi:hypothetical protein
LADVFISYSKTDRPLTEQLAEELQAKGFSVWWDTALVSGDRFRDVILVELAKARAAIVVWTAGSVKSDWVISEASRARVRGILITVRTADVGAGDIPPPFDVLHTDLVANRPAIFAALAKLGLSPKLEQPKPADDPPSRLSEASIVEALALEYWQAIKGTADPARLRAFLAEFGTARTARLARERLEALEAAAWDRLPGRKTIDALRAFVADFPDGTRRTAAEAEMAALARAEEEQALGLAKEAQARQAMLTEYETAMASADAAMLEAFLARHPRGTQADEVRRKLRRLRRSARRPWRRALIGAGLVGAATTGIWLVLFRPVDEPNLGQAAVGETSRNLPSRQKSADRIEPNPSLGPAKHVAAVVAQRVVLYEEDPNNASGKNYVGSSVWRTEMVSPGPGLASEMAVRADIEIPDRKMNLTLSFRRNADKSLPASHTVDITFKLPKDFAHGAVQNVPGVLVKDTEQARGVPLAGLAVKVTDGYFLIGLSATDADRARNIQLLKERSWFDLPMVYTDNRRAIMAVEKGTPGDRAFKDAFAAWKE